MRIGDAHLRRRPVKPCPKPGRCLFCWRILDNYPDGVTCKAKDVRGRPGIPHSWAALAGDDDCPDDTVVCPCGAPVGGFHHWECDLEICPWADEHPDEGEQLLYCPCFHADEP